VNKRALHIIFNLCVLHRHALSSKALQEFLTIVLKHVSECANFIKDWLVFSKSFSKDELIDLYKTFFQIYILQLFDFFKFWSGLGEEFPTQPMRAY